MTGSVGYRRHSPADVNSLGYWKEAGGERNRDMNVLIV